MTPDLVVVGGTVHTMDPALPRAEALAIADGRIVAAGGRRDVETLAGPGTRRVHFEGATVLPGFNDAHVHVWKIGQLRTTLLDLREARSLDEIHREVARRARTVRKGEWIVGRGWNEAHLKEREGPSRDGLDRAAPDHPVLLTRTCAHVHALNSAALAAAAVEADTPAPRGGAIDARRGILSETAYGLVHRVLPAPSVGDYERWIMAGAEHLRDLGITSATDAAVDPTAHAAYRNLERARRLPLRMNLLHLLRPDLGGAPYALPRPVVSGWLRCDTVKLFADGALSAATAALSRAYAGRDADRGILRLDADEIHALGRTARQAGYRLATHAIGDRALDEVLEAYRRLHSDDEAAPPPRIEHFALPTAAHIETALRLGVPVVTQPIFLRELAGNFRSLLPAELIRRCYPLATLHRAGLSLAFSSDGPVVRDLSPLAGVAAAATAALVESEAVHVGDALAAYTRGGAAAQGDSDNRGILSLGRWADFVVLDRDPLETPPSEVGGIRVRQTFVAGRASGGPS